MAPREDARHERAIEHGGAPEMARRHQLRRELHAAADGRGHRAMWPADASPYDILGEEDAEHPLLDIG